MEPWWYVPGLAVVVVLAGAGAFYWLATLQARVNGLAERVAYLEGKRDADST